MFCLGPVILWMRPFLLGQKSFDRALFWDDRVPTRILLVPRDGRGQPRIIETEPFFQFHFANGFEEDGALVLDLAALSPLPHDPRSAARLLGVRMAERRHGGPDPDAGRPGDRQGREQDLRQRHGQRVPLHQSGLLGQAPRYAYIACNLSDRKIGLQQQLAKVDLETGAVTRHDSVPGGYPGEPIFIATRPGGAEDDGVVVTLVFDAARQRSEIVWPRCA